MLVTISRRAFLGGSAAVAAALAVARHAQADVELARLDDGSDIARKTVWPVEDRVELEDMIWKHTDVGFWRPTRRVALRFMQLENPKMMGSVTISRAFPKSIPMQSWILAPHSVIRRFNALQDSIVVSPKWPIMWRSKSRLEKVHFCAEPI